MDDQPVAETEKTDDMPILGCLLDINLLDLMEHEIGTMNSKKSETSFE